MVPPASGQHKEAGGRPWARSPIAQACGACQRVVVPMESFLIVVAAALVVGVVLFLVLSRYEGPVIDLTEDDRGFPPDGQHGALTRDEGWTGPEGR